MGTFYAKQFDYIQKLNEIDNAALKLVNAPTAETDPGELGQFAITVDGNGNPLIYVYLPNNKWGIISVGTWPDNPAIPADSDAAADQTYVGEDPPVDLPERFRGAT